MNGNRPILSVDMNSFREDDAIVFVANVNLKQVFEKDGKYYVRTILGTQILSEYAKEQYLGYQKLLDECPIEDYPSSFTYAIKSFKELGFSTETHFTSKEILYFDMTFNC